MRRNAAISRKDRRVSEAGRDATSDARSSQRPGRPGPARCRRETPQEADQARQAAIASQSAGRALSGCRRSRPPREGRRPGGALRRRAIGALVLPPCATAVRPKPAGGRACPDRANGACPPAGRAGSEAGRHRALLNLPTWPEPLPIRLVAQLTWLSVPTWPPYEVPRGLAPRPLPAPPPDAPPALPPPDPPRTAPPAAIPAAACPTTAAAAAP